MIKIKMWFYLQMAILADTVGDDVMVDKYSEKYIECLNKIQPK